MNALANTLTSTNIRPISSLNIGSQRLYKNQVYVINKLETYKTKYMRFWVSSLKSTLKFQEQASHKT